MNRAETLEDLAISWAVEVHDYPSMRGFGGYPCSATVLERWVVIAEVDDCHRPHLRVYLITDLLNAFKTMLEHCEQRRKTSEKEKKIRRDIERQLLPNGVSPEWEERWRHLENAGNLSEEAVDWFYEHVKQCGGDDRF